ncbi:deoxyguanosinetriphosphate triphosphohydrolase family protein [Streptomyces sp. NPDC001668]|uniref:deoxyguanosinetriphosphate triphosphohydrolase family protein n=1 Tax=Streptomyces sp. NPDC001668 TaxID=3364598 RepID=UPI00368FB41E
MGIAPDTPPFDAWRLREDRKAVSNYGDKDKRTYFEHDRDRILYSSAFRRLAGVTQVAAVREHHLLHNRLTHSLKVAQLGRRIAQRIHREGFDPGFEAEYLPDVVESAGLAHDIGHPPFGHIAEYVLMDKMREIGGFEGNAQSFRVVTKLAVAWEEQRGLNLTRATLNGILKYPQYEDELPATDRSTGKAWTNRSYGSKWGVYSTESEEFEFARARVGAEERNKIRSPAAVIMDWADDVSYATHDLQDYFRAGLIPLHTLAMEETEATEDFYNFVDRRLTKSHEGYRSNLLRSEYERLKGEVPKRKWRDLRADRTDLAQTVNEFIARFANSLQIDSSSPSGLLIPDGIQYQVEALKQLTWFYVINRPSLALAQEGQKGLIARLFDELEGLLERRNASPGMKNPVPAFLGEIYDDLLRYESESPGRSMGERQRRARAVCDYICVLTEDQAVDLYERITGLSVSRGSIFGAWFD